MTHLQKGAAILSALGLVSMFACTNASIEDVTKGSHVGDGGSAGTSDGGVEACVPQDAFVACTSEGEVCEGMTCTCGLWIPTDAVKAFTCAGQDGGTGGSAGASGTQVRQGRRFGRFVWLERKLGFRWDCGTSGTGGSAGASGTAGAAGSGGSGGSPECQFGTIEDCMTSCGSSGKRGCQVDQTWGPCIAPTEVCNGKDDNCDGQIDEGVCSGVCTPGQTGKCATSCGSIGTATCGSNGQWVSCEPPVETCGNGKDDDCDGIVDNGCTSQPPGMSTVTYKYWLPSQDGAANMLTIYDEADDANGDPLDRPSPFGKTLEDTSYAWGTAVDGPNYGCFTSLAGYEECTVHRPKTATAVRANVHVILPNGVAFWACASTNGVILGKFEVWVDGKLAPTTIEPWWYTANVSFCRVVYHP